MKTIKKILCAILISIMTLFVMPTIMPIIETGYTVEAATVKISKTKYTMNKGEKYTLKVSGTKKKVKWSTSNKKVATVNSKGKVTAKKKGTATITAKVGSKKYKCKITVEDPSISKTKINLENGNTYTLKVKNTKRSVKWSTSNKKIATVNSKGKVTAKKAGTVTITAKVGNKKLKCKVTVVSPDYKKKVSTSYTKLSNGKILVSMKNAGKQKLDYVEINVNFYKNGSLLDSKMTNTVCLPVGKTAYSKVSVPVDSNYNNMEYDQVKIIVTKASVYEYVPYKDLTKNLSITHNKSQLAYYGVIGEATNVGSSEIKSAEIGVIYYKDGKIIDYSVEYLYSLKSGASETIKFSKPHDENYKDLEFDSYKVVINYAYAY